MKKLPFLRSVLCATILLGLAATAQAQIKRVVEKDFTVQTGGLLRVDTHGGNITIRTDATSQQVHVEVAEMIDADDNAEANELLEKFTLRLEQRGNEVSVSNSYEQHSFFRFHNGMWPPVRVSYTITVPHNFNLQLNTSGGNIEVAAIKGTLNVHTSGGNLKFDGVDGELNGKTSGGNIRATFTATPSQDSTLSTSGGDIRVQVSKDAGFELDASTSGGQVSTSGLSVSDTEINTRKTRMSGTINAGGPMLTLHTSGGSVRVSAD